MTAVSSPNHPDVTDRRTVAGRVRGHREVLILALLIGLAAPLLRVYPPDRVGWRWSADLLLPPLCAFRQCFGIPCPGCGMTRSFVYLASGDLLASWHMHRLGILVAFLIVLQIPYRLLVIRRPEFLLPDVVTRWLGRVLITMLLVNWLVNLFVLR